jgi:hypothetical protein
MPIASGRYPHSRVVWATAWCSALSPAREPDQQHCRFAGREGVQADRGRVIQRRQVPAAGHQHQAAAGARQQRPDLLAAGRVVEQQQQRLARCPVPPQRRSRLQVRRD